MLDPVTFVLPIPPSVNNLFINTRSGRVSGSAYKRWRQEAGWAIKLGCGAFVPPLLTGIVGVKITAPLNRRRDLDNALKPLLDILVRMEVISDDNLIDDLHIVRAGVGDTVRVEICRLVPA